MVVAFNARLFIWKFGNLHHSLRKEMLNIDIYLPNNVADLSI